MRPQLLTVITVNGETTTASTLRMPEWSVPVSYLAM